jgi:hypothetical protein
MRGLEDSLWFQCKFESPNDLVVLEVSGQDATICSIGSILDEMATDGVVDATINSHELIKPKSSEEAVESEVDGVTAYQISPKSDKPLIFRYSKPKDDKAKKFTNAASLFTSKELLNSPRLQQVWRIVYSSEDTELSPKKPLYIFKTSLQDDKGILALKKGQVIRLI